MKIYTSVSGEYNKEANETNAILTKKKLLTILVPTHNRKLHVETVIAKLCTLADRAKFCIHIVDNASKENLCELVQGISMFIDCQYTRWEQNTGSFELSMQKFASSQKFTTDFVWILGDDDLPISNAFKILINDIENYCDANRSSLIRIFAPINNHDDNNTGTLEFASTSSYFNFLINKKLYDSIFGFTFISNVVLPVALFELAYGPTDPKTKDILGQLSLPISPPSSATCQSVVAALAREEELQTRVFSVKLFKFELVKIAFKPILTKSDLCEEELSNEQDNSSLIHDYAREFALNWALISSSWFYIASFKSTHSAEWFRYMQLYYLDILTPFLLRIPIRQCCPIELAVLLKMATLIYSRNDLAEFRNLNLFCTYSKQQINITYSESSFPKWFFPFLGWCKVSNVKAGKLSYLES